MSKRMKFSVVGLPHYTIWHLYEPSVDDLRHMKEMERERKQREAEEKEKKEKAKKIKEQFKDSSVESEKDSAAVHDIMQKDKTQQQLKEKEKKQQQDKDKASKQSIGKTDSSDKTDKTDKTYKSIINV